MKKRDICFIAVLAIVAGLLIFKSLKKEESIGTPDATPQPETEEQWIAIEPGEAHDAEIPVRPTPAPTFDPEAPERLHRLDLDVFRWYATSDGYSLHMLVSDPGRYGIDRASVPMTFGEFSEAYSERVSEEARGYLDTLRSISRLSLNEAEQLTYDTLEQYLADLADEREFDYYYEPLTAYDGIHSELPLMLALYQMDSEQDVEDYLSLLADVPRYLTEVLEYEQEKAKRGYFMREEALDDILDDCDAIIRSKKTSFLYTTFRDAVDDIGELTEAEREDYIGRNDALIRKDLIGAYSELAGGLKKLRKYCRADEGAYALGENGAAYFVYRMQEAGNNLLSADETLELLKNEIAYALSETVTLLADNPELASADETVSMGSVEDDIAYARKITERILPPLPEHSLTLDAFPEELEKQMSPACYVIPPLDAWNANRIFVNHASTSDTPFLTAAHEGYPGHLYQHVYQRGNGKLGLMQLCYPFGGYAEGWAQMAEYIVTDAETEFSRELMKLSFYDSMLANALIPASVSILVNYYGYSRRSIVSYIAGLNLSREYADVCYDLAIDQPYYVLGYAIGYAQLSAMLRDAETDLGDAFDRAEFLKTYLDLGPSYFNLLSERMDVWLDEKIYFSTAE